MSPWTIDSPPRIAAGSHWRTRPPAGATLPSFLKPPFLDLETLTVASPRVAQRIDRRSFLEGSLAAAAVAVVPGGGFAAGSDGIRIGLVGCGGRGVGAALQAAANRGVVIAAVGDSFSDQALAAAEAVVKATGRPVPADAIFSGDDAAARVIAADVDAVILATPPAFRPNHVVAAVHAGRHIYCEPPAAVDAAGVRRMLEVAGEARARGLSIASGLQSRHHAPTAAMVERIHAGDIGRPWQATAIHHLGLPWRRASQPGWSSAEASLRNWIADDGLSGGGFVEHLIHAIDRSLWALGDEPPMTAIAVRTPEALPAAVGVAPVATIRFEFTAGTILEAAVVRRAGVEGLIDERLRGTAGWADLHRRLVNGRQTAAGPASPSPHAACMASFLSGIRAGRRVDDLESACRSTLVAVMGRMAGAGESPVCWTDLWPTA